MLSENETFVPTQTPTGMNVGEIHDRLAEIDAEEAALAAEVIRLTGDDT